MGGVDADLGCRWWALEGSGEAGGEAVEAGGAVTAGGGGGVGFDEEVGGEHAAAEVPLVERAAEDAFVDGLEVGEGEALREEAVGGVGVLQLVDQAAAGDFEDAVVVEGEDGELGHGEPGGLPGGALGQADAGVVYEGEVGDGGGGGGGVVEAVEGVELLEEDVGDAGLVGELAGGGGVEGFCGEEGAAGDGPVAVVGGGRSAG